jgi:hypothetical protein
MYRFCIYAVKPYKLIKVYVYAPSYCRLPRPREVFLRASSGNQKLALEYLLVKD